METLGAKTTKWKNLLAPPSKTIRNRGSWQQRLKIQKFLAYFCPIAPEAMGFVTWTLQYGPCFVDPAMWTLLCGPCNVDPPLWTLLRGPCFVDPALWTLLRGPCFVDPALWTLLCGPFLANLLCGHEHQI